MKVFGICDPHLSSASPSSRLDDYPTSILNKIVEVYKMASPGDVVVFVGDIFHTAAQPDYIKKALLQVFKNFPDVSTYLMAGNHDILYYRLDSLSKVSLGILAESVPMLDGKYVTLNDKFDLYGISFGEKLPAHFNKKTIVMGHAMYNRDDKLTLSQEELRESDAWCVVLGHDHSQYPIIQEDGTFLVRPGALSRGTSVTDSYERVISVAVIDTELEFVEYVPVPCMGADKIFKTNTKPKKHALPTFSEIQEFVQKLKDVNVNTNPFDILYGFNLPPAVHHRTVQYLTDAGLNKENLSN